MTRETDEEFIVRMRTEQKLAPPLIESLVRALQTVRSNCRTHRWRAESEQRCVA